MKFFFIQTGRINICVGAPSQVYRVPSSICSRQIGFDPQHYSPGRLSQFPGTDREIRYIDEPEICSDTPEICEHLTQY
jgi:hypothetical protein